MIVCQDTKPNARIVQIETILVFISISFSVRSEVANQKGGLFRTVSDRLCPSMGDFTAVHNGPGSN